MSFLMTAMINLSAGPWIIVNDGVMGGRSRSRIEATDGGIRFTGFLSLENNGGFSSTRHRLAEAPEGMAGVRIELRGDGRSYQLRLRQDQQYDGVAWSATFPTSGEWQTIEIPFSGFHPLFRGKRVADAGAVKPAAVSQIGIMLADKQQGPFELEIRQLGFYQADE